MITEKERIEKVDKLEASSRIKRNVKTKRQEGYYVLNLRTGENFEGDVENAKEAYSKITIRKGDTTLLRYGYQTSVKEW